MSSVLGVLLEFEPLDLAGRPFGHFLDEHDFLGRFIFAQMLQAMLSQFFLAAINPRLERAAQHDLFAVVLVRYGAGRRVQDGGMLVSGLVDLAGSDIFTALDNELFQTAGHKYKAIFIHVTQIAGMQPSVLLQGLGGDVGRLVIFLHHKHAYRLIYKVRNHRDVFNHLYEKKYMDDDPDLVVVSYGTPSRVVNTAVEKARSQGMKVGALRLINLWPFPDEHFTRKTKYLSVELTWDGQLVREVQRAAPKDSQVNFLGTCGDLPTIPDLLETFEKLLKDQPLERKGWELEAW